MRTKKGRSKGSGTLYKSGGRYYGRITVNGKRITVATKCTTREEAEKFMEAYTFPLRAGDNRAKLEHIASEIRILDGDMEGARRTNNDLPIGEIMERVFAIHPLSVSTRWDYRAAFDRLSRFLAERHPDVVKMSQIVKSVAEGFRDFLASGPLHPMTANHYIKKLGTSWNALAEDTGLSNPWKGLKLPGRSTPYANLSDGEFEAVMVAARKTGGDVSFLFELGTETAMRLSDCCLLRWESIDMERRLITFIPKKLARHGKSVQLPMSQKVYNIIAERADGTQSGYVCRELAMAYSSRQVGKMARDVFDRAGIPPRSGKSFHSLRVHAITRMLDAGIPLATVQAIAGHASPEMTQHYYRLDIDRARAALDGLDQRRDAHTPTTTSTPVSGGGGDILSIVGALTPEQRAALKVLL